MVERLGAAGRGEGRLIWLAGEPGIGKTRLLAEFMAQARTLGWLVLSGSAYETEGMPPYLPFAEALRDYLRGVAATELEDLIADSKAELALLLPELRDGSSGSESGAGETDRYQLFERITNFLLNVSRGSECNGLLLCLDDLHWADRSTLLLLHHMTRKLHGAPLLIAGAYRTEEVEPTRPLFSLLADLAREHLDERLSLQPLSIEQTGDVIKRAGIEAGQPVVEAIYKQTQGNPFYLEEVLRELRANSLLNPDLGAADWSIPEGIRQVIGKRLLSLRPEAKRLLQAGAVLGDGFQFEIAVAMTDIEETILMDALDQAIGAGLLQEQGESCRFAHPLIQRTVYDGLTAARRRALHLRAARAIETTYGRYLEPYLSPLAVNYRLAGARADPEKAIDYSVLAGTSAEKSLAYDEAHAHWQAALGLMERYALDPMRRADLLGRIGDLMQVVGFDKYAESARNFKQAIELYEDAGAKAEAASVRARLGLLLGAGGPINDNVAALKYLHAAEEVLESAPLSEAQLWLYSGLGLVAVWQVRPAEGMRASGRAMELAPLLGHHDRWVTNAIMCGYHLQALGRLHEGFELMTRAWERADEIDQTYPAYVAATWISGRLRELGDPKEAAAWCLKEVSQRRQDEAPSRRRALWSFIATTKAMAGDLEGCRRLVAEERLPPEPERAFWLGDWDQAASAWARRCQLATTAGNLTDYARFCIALARLRYFQGDEAGAVNLLREALAIGQDGPHSIFRLRAGAELAILLAGSGEIDEATVLLRQYQALLDNGEDWRGLTGRVTLAAAMVAMREGDPRRAESLFAAALAIFEDYSLPWDEAEAYLLWGSLLARMGRRHRQAAREWFDKALETYTNVGAAQTWRDAVLALRGKLIGEARHGDVPGNPDGLTDREVEVLRLVAAGRSNREIANELVLSVRTAERHIANVYTKIGVRTKAQATAYAMTRSLVKATD